jgi:hypothetical protein
MRASHLSMMCDWDAMMNEHCTPTVAELHSLADDFSPTRDEKWQRRESVKVLSVSPVTILLEEILCEESHCIAISYEIPKPYAMLTFERHEAGAVQTAVDESLAAELRELASILNQSPVIVKGLACRYAQDLRPTDTVESATVVSLDMSALHVELVAIDLVELGQGRGRMPRRSLGVSIPLSRACDAVADVEDAIVKLICMMEQGESETAPEFWI